MAYQDGSYRIGANFIALSAFDETYEVRRFPRQADQGYWKWFFPTGDSGVYDDVAEVIDGLDGSAQGQGSGNFVWHLAAMTPLMVNYWVEIIFGGAYSRFVTVMTWDRAYGWRTVYAMARRKLFRDSATPGGRRGYMAMDIEFIVWSEASDFDLDEFDSEDFL